MSDPCLQTPILHLHCTAGVVAITSGTAVYPQKLYPLWERRGRRGLVEGDIEGVEGSRVEALDATPQPEPESPVPGQSQPPAGD